MSALSDIRDKPFESWTAIEKCIVECWEMQGLEWMAEQAASELAALTQQKEKAEAKVSEAFIAGWNNYSDAFDHQPLTDEIGEHSLKMRLEAFLRGN